MINHFIMLIRKYSLVKFNFLQHDQNFRNLLCTTSSTAINSNLSKIEKNPKLNIDRKEYREKIQKILLPPITKLRITNN